MTTITISLPEKKIERVEEAAAQLGIPIEVYVEKTVDAVLIRRQSIENTFDYVLKKNTELYRPLAH